MYFVFLKNETAETKFMWICLLSLLGLPSFVVSFPPCRFRPLIADGSFGRRRSQQALSLLQSTMELCENACWKMTRFFGQDMVDPTSNRFYCYCYPSRGECVHFHFPIRDLAAAWDATKALGFSFAAQSDCGFDNFHALQYQLADAIRVTVVNYFESLSPIAASRIDGATCVSEDVLNEDATIGHSALLLLAWSGASRLGIFLPDEPMPVESVVKGILSMQMKSGAFGCSFRKPDEYLTGIEFFPGEAMLALMDIYALSKDTKTRHSIDITIQESILLAMERAFKFYSQYYDKNEPDVNYNIWQAQAFARHYDSFPGQSDQKEAVAKYVLDLCHEICQSRSWKHQLARGTSFYVNLETVEVVCGLDALSEGFRIAQEQKDEDSISKFRIHIMNAVRFVGWVQDQVPEDVAVGHGGLGYGGIQVLEQRLDVTGHGLSAMTKLHRLALQGKYS